MHSPQWASSINSSLSKERNTWKNETNETRQRSVHVPLSIGRPWAENPPPRNRPYASNSPCQTFSYSASTTHQPCWRSSGRIGPTSRRRCRIGGTSSSPSSTRGMRNCSRGRPPGRITSTCWWPRVVGRVNLIEVADGSAELGYRIAQKAAGQGLATAAVCKVRELAATEYGLSRLRARVTQDNPASRKVLEHNGFVAVGELT